MANPKEVTPILFSSSLYVLTKTLLDAQWQSSGLNRKASTQLMPQGKGGLDLLAGSL